MGAIYIMKKSCLEFPLAFYWLGTSPRSVWHSHSALSPRAHGPVLAGLQPTQDGLPSQAAFDAQWGLGLAKVSMAMPMGLGLLTAWWLTDSQLWVFQEVRGSNCEVSHRPYPELSWCRFCCSLLVKAGRDSALVYKGRGVNATHFTKRGESLSEDNGKWKKWLLSSLENENYMVTSPGHAQSHTGPMAVQPSRRSLPAHGSHHSLELHSTVVLLFIRASAVEPSPHSSHGLSLLPLRSQFKYHFSCDILSVAPFHPSRPLCAGFLPPISAPKLTYKFW